MPVELTAPRDLCVDPSIRPSRDARCFRAVCAVDRTVGDYKTFVPTLPVAGQRCRDDRVAVAALISTERNSLEGIQRVVKRGGRRPAMTRIIEEMGDYVPFGLGRARSA